MYIQTDLNVMKFDWDDNKAGSNIVDHGVSFEEAATVFDDSFFLVFTDDDHSFNELRYWIIGESNRRRLLLTVYTERGEITRIISSREATVVERNLYESERYA